jgi:hypothetical protein
MYKESKLTTQATSCLTYAHKYADKKNHTNVSGDDLFAGIYFFIKETQHKDVFFNLIGIQNNEILDDFFMNEYTTTIHTKTGRTNALIKAKKI